MCRLYISVLLILLMSCAEVLAQDSLSHDKYIVRSVMVGAGKTNVYDTYLSPLEYRGPELRFMHESMRMTRLMGGRVSAQRIVQVNASSTDNISKSGKSYSGMFNWTYALHYQYNVDDRLKILFGPMLDLNGGFIYNTRNSNNPAQAKVYGSIDASAMAIYKLRIGRYPMTLRYQANLPFIGVMFSPEYGQSYYEIFSLKHSGKNVLFTSFHNAPTVRQMLTLDFPIGKTIMRAGYLCDIQQAKVNNLKSHFYSHNFMIGFVRNFQMIRGKNRISLPSKVNPF
ncbi:DUF3316 domain-containing protein [Bacteroides caecigallinarum]|uniref:DUF3316 domain-containing protein n=1 Tax=Candidatus Phocaeicola faecigallinarum TaxID=2838732 RepID=A0A948WV04_9BACT|nr:DUF3316 domain-containing protein [Bacteroides caecigallinarum]MBU3837357.1 DUF3316 domain-containing protein [Candidatus Phocaeicola faecigallinarum]MCF2581992.1 DUF3316 domain-containing protein [Bacteroides caecigallinarum]